MFAVMILAFSGAAILFFLAWLAFGLPMLIH
jgi:hypothetical protein